MFVCGGNCSGRGCDSNSDGDITDVGGNICDGDYGCWWFPSYKF